MMRLSCIVSRALATDPSLRGCALSDRARKALLASADGDVRVAIGGFGPHKGVGSVGNLGKLAGERSVIETSHSCRELQSQQ